MIEIISGTNRPGNNTLKVSQQILELYKTKGVDAQILNLQDLPMSLFDPAAYGEKPKEFEPFQKRVLDADGLHIVMPEYNGSFPGVLKYFIDMLKFPESFENCCVAFTGVAAGEWGGLRPCEQLQMVFGYRNAFVCPNRVFINGVYGKLDEQGKIKDEKTQKFLENQVLAFSEFVKRDTGLKIPVGE